MADQVTLLDLNFGTSEAEKGLDALIAKSMALAKTKKDLQAAYASEKKELDALNQNYADGLVQQDKYDATVKKLNKSLIETQKAILDNTERTNRITPRSSLQKRSWTTRLQALTPYVHSWRKTPWSLTR
jgi:hypothetical protein